MSVTLMQTITCHETDSETLQLSPASPCPGNKYGTGDCQCKYDKGFFQKEKRTQGYNTGDINSFSCNGTNSGRSGSGDRSDPGDGSAGLEWKSGFVSEL